VFRGVCRLLGGDSVFWGGRVIRFPFVFFPPFSPDCGCCYVDPALSIFVPFDPPLVVLPF